MSPDLLYGNRLERQRRVFFALVCMVCDAIFTVTREFLHFSLPVWALRSSHHPQVLKVKMLVNLFFLFLLFAEGGVQCLVYHYVCILISDKRVIIKITVRFFLTETRERILGGIK